MQRWVGGFVTGLVLAATGCPAPGWWCQAEPGKQPHDDRRKCYAKAEFCNGACEHRETAYCYETGHGSRVGNFDVPPDRFCYATAEDCQAEHAGSADATAPCAPASK